MLRGHAEVPTDAIVDPVQAESALGHVQATEFDDEDLETLDAALRAETEAPGIVSAASHDMGSDLSTCVRKLQNRA